MTYLLTGTGLMLVLIGLWAILTKHNLIKMIIGFSIMDTGVHLIIVGVGYIEEGVPPIFSSLRDVTDSAARAVDPVPSALVLTAIVIGLAVTALLLAYAVRMYMRNQSLNIEDYREMLW